MCPIRLTSVILWMFRYNWPLLEIIGFTSTLLNFSIAFVLMMGESTQHYDWALDKLQHMLCGVKPTSIVTDRELGLINALKVRFPDSTHLLCKVHVLRDIKAYAWKKTHSTEKQDKFHEQCNALFYSKSEKSFERRRQRMHEEWGQQGGLMSYLEATWLRPYRRALVRAWTNSVLHFGTTSTNRYIFIVV